jgi:uncharacterized protein involved in exopolysaccharide biosynthesis
MLKQMPIKRSKYFALSAVLALLVSGGLAYFTHQPQWKTSFSYQYLAPDGVSMTFSDTKPIARSSFYPDSVDPIATQIEIMRSDRFLQDIRIGLEKASITGWSKEKIATSIHISNPLHSNLLHVDVQTPDKEATQKIAILLSESYTTYMQTLQQQMLAKEKAFVEKSLADAKTKLSEGEKNLHKLLAANPQVPVNPLMVNPDLNEKTFIQGYVTLTQRIKETEADIALEDTKYNNYKALLHDDEATLIEGVILGEDPTLEKITDQLASAETDANILSIKYTPQYPELADTSSRIKTLQKQLDEHRRRILGGQSAQGKPIIRDSLRKNLIEDLLDSKIKLQASEKVLEILSQQRNELLKSFEQVTSTSGDYSSWLLQKNMMQDTIVALEKRMETLNYQLQTLSPPIQFFQEIPAEPSSTQDTQGTLVLFVSAFSGLFFLLGAVPFVIDYQANIIPTRSILSIVKELLRTKGQQVIVMMPVYSSGHLNASAHLGGLLNQFGKDAIVIDIDLRHRLLSRKIPLDHPHGVLEHLITPDMRKTYNDPLSSAKILPLEASLDADRVVEFSQILQRLPRLWERWPGSIIILDISQWHEAYHQLLPYISQVIFYVPPSSQSNILLPKVFKGKYHVPVSLVEIQPDL